MFNWEEQMLEELQHMVSVVMLKLNAKDRWIWFEDTSEEYSVKSGYKLLQNSPNSQRDPF